MPRQHTPNTHTYTAEILSIYLSIYLSNTAVHEVDGLDGGMDVGMEQEAPGLAQQLLRILVLITRPCIRLELGQSRYVPSAYRVRLYTWRVMTANRRSSHAFHT